MLRLARFMDRSMRLHYRRVVRTHGWRNSSANELPVNLEGDHVFQRILIATPVIRIIRDSVAPGSLC